MGRYLNELLPTNIYNPLTIVEVGMNKNCEHNYEEKNIEEFCTYATAKCNKCGGKVIIEVYE